MLVDPTNFHMPNSVDPVSKVLILVEHLQYPG